MQSTEAAAGTDRMLAYALLRLVLGMNLLMHGVSRILAGVSYFAHSLLPQFSGTPLSTSLVYAFGLTLPYAETILGALLMLGLWTRYACVLGMLLLAVLTFGSALHQDWNAAGIQLVYAVVYAALLGLRRLNLYSVDAWMLRRKET